MTPDRRRFRPHHDTPMRREYHRRLSVAYRAEMEFVLRAEAAIYAQDAELVRGPHTQLYVVADGFEALKFGVARNPAERLAGLQIGNPRPLLLLADAPGTVALERLLHRLMVDDRISGEWFRTTNRVLALASLVVAAAEQCDDVTEHGGGELGAEFTVASMSYRCEVLAA